MPIPRGKLKRITETTHLKISKEAATPPAASILFLMINE